MKKIFRGQTQETNKFSKAVDVSTCGVFGGGAI